VGWTAGDLIVAGYQNTLIGAESGTTGSNDLVGGYQNTLIGQATSVSAAGAINQTVIGRGTAGQANNSVTLGNDDVTAVYMASDSGATVHCAGVVVTTGINFPDDATANPSADVNTLDNYEEGTWTPVITDGSNNATLTTALGQYTKIGNLVRLQGYIDVDTMGSVSGGITITGLPFTSKNHSGRPSVNFGFAANWALGTAGYHPTGQIDQNTAVITLYTWDATSGVTAMQQSEWSNGYAIFDVTYLT
jgi:hypothetical protein